MTTKTKMYLNYTQAFRLAERIKNELAPACLKIKIAGSIRRKAPHVGDIELVCIPKKHYQHDMFGGKVEEKTTLLDELLNNLVDNKRLQPPTLNGPKQKKYALFNPDGFNLDIFIATPENWGYILAIRTGDAWFSKKIVTQSHKKGFLPDSMHCDSGSLWLTKKNEAWPQKIITPLERDFFNYLLCGWLEPENRNRAYLKRAMII